LNILQATQDPQLFARWFKDRETWQAWFSFLAALFALPMSTDQLAIFRECTGRTEQPMERLQEAWLVCGRRAGKSFVLALIAVFLATFFNWRPYLSPGEAGYIIIIAADRRQARTIFKYLKALIVEVPMLAKLVAQENAESIELTNGVIIEVATCSYRTVRGRTIIAACAMRWLSGHQRTALRLTMRFWTRCGRAWRPSPVRCCSVRPRPTPAAVRCGTRIRGSTANPMPRRWFGRPRRWR
jgi:hypothetical protein